MRGSQSKGSARAGNAESKRADATAPTPAPDELRTLSRDELRAVAKRLGLTGVSSLKKDALLARVLEVSRRGTASPGAAAAKPAAAKPAAAPAPATPAVKPPARAAKPAAAPAAAKPAAKPPAPAAKPAAATATKPIAAPAAAKPAARPAAPVAPPPPRDAAPADREAPGSPASEDEPSATAKLDLGPGAAAAEKPPETIPWSYGQDRVTAAAVDPSRLFVYWEITEPAIERARADLGPGGGDAWLNLRVYDTTGRIFDGTNAHSYFDHGVGRDDRQWFFQIGKPSSSAYVELGMRSRAGHFVKIVRSGRVDFPRNAPVQEDAPEWLTVRVATGEAFPAGRGGARLPPPPPPPSREGGPAGAIPVVDLGTAPGGLERRIWQLLHGDGHRVEWQQLLGGAGWFQLEGRIEWEGPVLVTRWEAGPFTYPVTVEAPSREAWEGQSFAFKVGDVTHVVYGPWQVVIRNVGAFSERAEIARWEVFRSWVSEAGREVRLASLSVAGRPIGASEALGASERRWLSGSELRLGGASEVFRLGASELRMRGASETLLAGASERVARGASERRLGGASEVRMRGGSELRLGGASENRIGGASESHLGGGSEGRLGGSEQRLAPPDAAAPAPLPYPKAEE